MSRTVDSNGLLQLWLAYGTFKAYQLEQSTMKRDYGKITTRLAMMPDLPDPIAVRDWTMRRYSPETTRRMMQQFSACCSWATRSRYLRADPFAGLHKDFRKQSKGDRRAFTADERDHILTAVETNQYASNYGKWKHAYYLHYFQFLFWSGCRLEEGNGLHWEDVSEDYATITFQRALPADTRILGNIKTHQSREFRCNTRMKRLLSSVERKAEYVFVAPRNGPIDSHNVLNRTWRPVLEGLVDDRKIRYYLPLKHCRHTFITLALEAGLDAKDVAALVGNSPDIIYRHYAAVRPDLDVPEF